MEILVFGQLTDVLQTNRLSWPEVEDTDTLRQQLLAAYPLLQQHSFAVAVNQQLVSGNAALKPDVEIALLPPFSGG